MTSKATGVNHRKQVYEAILEEYKSAIKLREELGFSSQVVQNALRSLIAVDMIIRRGELEYGPPAEYKAKDSSTFHTFEDKLRMTKDKVPDLIGRCDFAASWVPRQDKSNETSSVA